MTRYGWLLLPLLALFLIPPGSRQSASACCAVARSGQPVVNADQSVIIIWDAATKTQHFIRRASFKGEGDDFGFLVPTPNQPQLSESGNEAFPTLQKLTEPETKKMPKPAGNIGCGCAAMPMADAKLNSDAVTVLDQRVVAGFNATVLEANSATAVVGWLRDHGYAFSPAVEAWAKPYVEQGWKITALKVVKSADEQQSKTVNAAALRLSFQTDRPLFPYREPDSGDFAQKLNAQSRLLRIYFLADARYQGEIGGVSPWSGRVAWAGKVTAADRQKVLTQLALPDATGPADWYLTEFEDNWRYQVAPGDVYFSRAADQKDVRRPPVIQYVAAPWPADATVFALAAAVIGLPLLTRWRRK